MNEGLLWRTEFSCTCPLCGNAFLRVIERKNAIACGRGHWWLFGEIERVKSGKNSETWLINRIAKRGRLLPENCVR